jgi:hypothetical protein
MGFADQVSPALLGPREASIDRRVITDQDAVEQIL